MFIHSQGQGQLRREADLSQQGQRLREDPGVLHRLPGAGVQATHDGHDGQQRARELLPRVAVACIKITDVQSAQPGERAQVLQPAVLGGAVVEAQLGEGGQAGQGRGQPRGAAVEQAQDLQPGQRGPSWWSQLLSACGTLFS